MLRFLGAVFAQVRGGQAAGAVAVLVVGDIPEEEEEGELHCANARRQLTSDDDLAAAAAAARMIPSPLSVRPSVVGCCRAL